MAQHILHFTDINTFFATTGFEKRTDLPEFFVFRFDELPKEGLLQMPPYRKDFYQITLILHAENAEIGINQQASSSLENALYFLSPEHIFWWQRSVQTTGFVIYFKEAFLSAFTRNVRNDFSFFDLAEKNILQLTSELTDEIGSDFDQLHREFYRSNAFRPQILQALLVSLLFKLKGLNALKDHTLHPPSKKHELVFHFQNLVNNCYLTHKQVQMYAERLFTSANVLNKAVKDVTGKTAKSIIADRIVREAQKRLAETSDDVAQIAYHLGFDEPTHFIRFFKTHRAETPKEYRNRLR